MSDLSLNQNVKDRLREVLDWAVFSLGLFALSTAIAAAVVAKTDIVRFEATKTIEADTLAG